jgi:hypothetical protein
MGRHSLPFFFKGGEYMKRIKDLTCYFCKNHIALRGGHNLCKLDVCSPDYFKEAKDEQSPKQNADETKSIT